jgi:hypothetical protein
VLNDWGFDKAEIDALIAQGTVAEDTSDSADGGAET